MKTTTIHLPSLPTFIINAVPHHARLQPCLDRLHALGFQKLAVLQPRASNPYWTGLKAATRTALKCEPPFLIFEDDAAPIPGFYRPTVTLPASTDCVNLGPALAGYPRDLDDTWKTQPTGNAFAPLRWQDATEDFIRIGNMLFTHAMLFLTPHACKMYTEAIKYNQNRDVCDTFVQPLTQTLAPKRAMFYQIQDKHEAITLAGFAGIFDEV